MSYLMELWHVRLTWLLFVVQDIVHDIDTQSEDWYIALEALLEVIFSMLTGFIIWLFLATYVYFSICLCSSVYLSNYIYYFWSWPYEFISCHSTLWSQVLPSLQPLIIYFPDSSEWLSRAVPKSHRREFIHKVEEMFDQLQGPVVLICGQNIIETGTKEKEKFVSFIFVFIEEILISTFHDIFMNVTFCKLFMILSSPFW